MPVKKAAKKTAKKKAVAKKAVKKKTAAKKTVKTKTGVKKGSKYVCRTCGLVVTVYKACGCVGVCDIICCGKQMAPKK